MIDQIMVECDTAMAVTAASPHLEEGKVMECEVSDEYFVQSSG
jgi:hypothetical protein